MAPLLPKSTGRCEDANASAISIGLTCLICIGWDALLMRASAAGWARNSEAQAYFTIKKTFPLRKFLYDWEQPRHNAAHGGASALCETAKESDGVDKDRQEM
jgi:hypothetical protein